MNFYAGYVPVRQVSFGLQDPDRKGGSDEWLTETRHKNRAGGLLSMGGLYFFDECRTCMCVAYSPRGVINT